MIVLMTSLTARRSRSHPQIALHLVCPFAVTFVDDKEISDFYDPGFDCLYIVS
jgi:hypothetical protein